MLAEGGDEGADEPEGQPGEDAGERDEAVYETDWLVGDERVFGCLWRTHCSFFGGDQLLDLTWQLEAGLAYIYSLVNALFIIVIRIKNRSASIS